MCTRMFYVYTYVLCVHVYFMCTRMFYVYTYFTENTFTKTLTQNIVRMFRPLQQIEYCSVNFHFKKRIRDYFAKNISVFENNNITPYHNSNISILAF